MKPPPPTAALFDDSLAMMPAGLPLPKLCGFDLEVFLAR